MAHGLDARGDLRRQRELAQLIEDAARIGALAVHLGAPIGGACR